MQLIYMAGPIEYNKVPKRDQKVGKYYWLCFKLREGRKGYMVKVILTLIWCFGGGIKELKGSIRQIFEYDNNNWELGSISWEMQKSVLWEHESQIIKVLSGLLTLGVSI